jgi:hypothetical protein
MKSFKGSPIAANKFKNNCKGITNKYSNKICKQALQGLMMGSSREDLEERFGEKIMNCFTQNDLNNFLK